MFSRYADWNSFNPMPVCSVCTNSLRLGVYPSASATKDAVGRRVSDERKYTMTLGCSPPDFFLILSGTDRFYDPRVLEPLKDYPTPCVAGIVDQQSRRG